MQRRVIFRSIACVFFIGVACAILLVGCRDNTQNRVLKILDSAPSYELLSIDFNESGKEAAPDYLRGYWVLGRTTINDKVIKEKLNDALRVVDTQRGASPACFNPRHAIHVKQDGRTHDVLICFECNSVNVYENEKYVGAFHPPSSAQPVINDILIAAGIPLAKTPE